MYPQLQRNSNWNNEVRLLDGLDNLLAKSLDSIIRTNLSERTLQQIENRLLEKYGVTMIESFKEFYKLHSVLKEFFGLRADELEKRMLENVCTLEESKNNGHCWLTIKDPHINKIILETFGDEDKKMILAELLDEPRIIPEVLDLCDIPQTSGYRKINSLINDGLLTTQGFVTTHDGKKINKYVFVFKNVQINILKDKVTVKLKLSKEIVNDSSVIRLIKVFSSPDVERYKQMIG